MSINHFAVGLGELRDLYSVQKPTAFWYRTIIGKRAISAFAFAFVSTTTKGDGQTIDWFKIEETDIPK